MEILALPVNWRKEEIMSVALTFGRSFKEVEDVSNKIMMVNYSTIMYLARNAQRMYVYRGSDLYSSDTKNCIFSHNGNFYVYKDVINSIDIRKATIFNCLFYEISPGVIQKAAEYFRTHEQIIRNISSYQSQIRDYHNSIRREMERLKEFTIPKIENLEKVCKKMKIGYRLMPTGLFELNFGKVTVGNETEGHIKYKNITIGFDFEWRQKYVVYQFSNWYYDSRWGINWQLHPHVCDSDMCFGNRLDDYNLYLQNNSWIFLIDLIKETVNAYNPGSPYVSVVKLSKALRVAQKAMQNVDMNKYKTDEEISQRLITISRHSNNTCQTCGDFIYDGSCINDNCVRNRDAQIFCTICGSEMSWNIVTRVQQCYGNHNAPPSIPTAPEQEPISGTPQFSELFDDIEDDEIAPVTARPGTAPLVNAICRECGRSMVFSNTVDSIERNGETLTQPIGYYCNDVRCSLEALTQITHITRDDGMIEARTLVIPEEHRLLTNIRENENG